MKKTFCYKYFFSKAVEVEGENAYREQFSINFPWSLVKSGNNRQSIIKNSIRKRLSILDFPA